MLQVFNLNPKQLLTLSDREGLLNILEWIPTVARRTELMDSHSSSDATWSLFGEFRTLWPDFLPIWGVSVKIAY